MHFVLLSSMILIYQPSLTSPIQIENNMALRILKLALPAFALLNAASAQWAQFCDDNACSVNCGISVELSNPGCLDEVGRGSIYFHDSSPDYALVFSPGGECPCQNECIDGIGADGCYNLDGHSFAESFRFIGDSCEANNC